MLGPIIFNMFVDWTQNYSVYKKVYMHAKYYDIHASFFCRASYKYTYFTYLKIN